MLERQTVPDLVMVAEGQEKEKNKCKYRSVQAAINGRQGSGPLAKEGNGGAGSNEGRRVGV